MWAGRRTRGRALVAHRAAIIARRVVEAVARHPAVDAWASLRRCGANLRANGTCRASGEARGPGCGGVVDSGRDEQQHRTVCTFYLQPESV